MWLFLLACDEYGLSSEAVDTGLDDIEIAENCDNELCIDEISPNWGPTSGGTEVRIYGTGFDGDVGISFGRLEVSDFTRLGTNQLLMYTPQGTDGPISVTVWSDYGEVEIENGFTYSDNGIPQDTGTQDSGSQDSGTQDSGTQDTGYQGDNSGAGLTGGVVEFGLVVDGFQLVSPEGYVVTASAMLHNPTQGSWLNWLAPMGSCINHANPIPLVASGNSYGQWAYLNAPNGSIPLGYSNGKYMATGLTSGDYIKGNSYSLSIPDGGIDISDVVTTAMGMGQNFGPSHYFAGGDYSSNYYFKDGTFFTWDVDSDPNSSMLFIFEVLDGSSLASLGLFQCHVSDTGSYQLPPDIFTGAIFGDVIIVQMLRLRQSSAIHPLNGSTIEGFSTTGGIGVAIFYQ